MGVIDDDLQRQRVARSVAREHGDPDDVPEWEDPVPYEPVPLEVYDDELDQRPHDLEELWAADEAATSEADPTPEQKIRAALLTGDEIKDILPPEPLIAGLLDRDSLAALYGAPGSGKSFLAVAWALSVATGTWWLGHEVHRAPVVYVVAEGAAGVGQRVTAWQEHEGVHKIDQLAWLPLAVNLRAAHWVQALTAVLVEHKPAMIVIDTLSRSMVGAEENSAKDMSEVVEACDRIRRATGACVLLVHHTGKTDGAGLRGSSALLGALDTSIELRSADELLRLEVVKQKNHSEPPVLRLQLTPSADSCVVTRYTDTDTDVLVLGADHVEMLHALRRLDLGDGVPNGEWQADVEVKVSTFNRRRKQLVDTGHCQFTSKGNSKRYSLTQAGCEAVGSITSTSLPDGSNPASPLLPLLPAALRAGSNGSDHPARSERGTSQAHVDPTGEHLCILVEAPADTDAEPGTDTHILVVRRLVDVVKEAGQDGLNVRQLRDEIHRKTKCANGLIDDCAEIAERRGLITITAGERNARIHRFTRDLTDADIEELAR